MNGVSIVIATKGRVQLLENLLESLSIARSNYEGNTEVILADDSTSEDAVKIDLLCKKYDARRITFSPSVCGRRNFGAKNANYDVVLFLDSDCIATPHIIEEHVSQYTDDRVGGVAGPLEFTGKESWFWKSVNATPFLICFKMPYWGPTSLWATTANFSVRKTAFEDIGGFDESFPNNPGGEDVDLGLRMTKKGYIIRNTTKGLVYHDKATWQAPKSMFRRCWYYGRADVYVVERHEDYSCNTMPRKLLLNLLGTISIILMAILVSPKAWILLPIWILGDWIIHSLLAMKFGYGDNDLLHQLFTQLMLYTNEAGYIIECLSQRKPSLISRQTVFVNNQIKGIPYNGLLNAMQFSLEFVVMIVIVWLIR